MGDKCMQCHSSLKHNKSDGFTELCVSYLLKFEISCHIVHLFFKFNVNLEMFTTTSMYEITVRTSY